MRRRLGILLVLTLSAAAACSSEDTKPLSARVAVFLQEDVADSPGPVEQRVRAVPGVTAVKVVTGEEVYAHLKEQMKDRPELTASIPPDTMPTSLEATVPDGSIAEVVELLIGKLDGVDDAVLAMGNGDLGAQKYIGVIMRLSAEVTEAQRDAIGTMVREMPGAEAISFETAEQALDRLRKRCDGNADLAAAFANVTAQDIPASYRFRIKLDRAKGSGLDPTRTIDGVDDTLLVPAEVV